MIQHRTTKETQDTQEMFVRTHALMVKRIAFQILRQSPPTIQLDDLIQAGMVGLLEALRHYDTSKGASFETYAGIRVRGHMLDEIRRNDWVPRSVYRNARIVSEAVKKVENRLGRDARDYEIAKELDLPLDKYNEIIKDSSTTQLLSFEDMGLGEEIFPTKTDGEPHSDVIREDVSKHLNQIVAQLSKNERAVIALYYKQDLNLKEIGEVLGVSESRVSQIHHQAMLHLRTRYENLLSGLSDEALTAVTTL